MSTDVFKYDFKFYKSRFPPPNLGEVIDLHNISAKFEEDVRHIPVKNSFTQSDLVQYGFRPTGRWDSFSFTKRKGLLLVKNPFSGAGQRYWVSRCLKDYTRKPNKLNLDIHGDLTNSEEWWDKCQLQSTVDKTLMKKLRWSTLGYHHDWDTKVYSESNRNEFPEDLSKMCKMVAQSLGFDHFVPQASIVNYYHMDSTLAPHTDHSEVNLDAPLISISFGQSAVFLIGGETKCVKPLPIFLHSGDIVIMSKESRLCYHAVPKIIASTSEPWNQINSTNDFESQNNNSANLSDGVLWKPFNNYLLDSRININVRQVLNNENETLEDFR